MERYPDLPYVAFQMQSNGKYLFKYSCFLSDHMYLDFCPHSKILLQSGDVFPHVYVQSTQMQ